MSINTSLKHRLLFSYLFVIISSFGLLAFFLDKSLEENSLEDIKSSLLSQAALIVHQIPPASVKEQDIGCLNTLANELDSKINSRITILNGQGRVLADSRKTQKETLDMENHMNRPEIRSAIVGKAGIEIRYSSTLKIDMLYVALPLKDGNELIGVLRLALPLTNVQKTLSGIRQIVFIGLSFALALAFLIGIIFTSRIINPVNNIIQVSRRFAQGDFSRKIFLRSRDEIGELGDALNKMAQEIEDKIREIKKQNQHLAAVLNSMVEGVIVLDRSGRMISINPTAEKIFGVEDKDIKGRLFLEAIRNNDIYETISCALEKGASVSKDITLVWPVHRIFQVNVSPIFENDAVTGCLAVIHDITQMKRLETMRRDFVANVSHELKTPLTSIKGFVETLLEGALDDKENSRHFLTIIREHTGRLDNLINDLLDLSYLESREINLEKDILSLKDLVSDVLAGFKAVLRKRNIEARNDLGADTLIKADNDKIGQVFTNLIDNAIKFNKEKGHIKIYSEKLQDKIRITVEDSGMGIPDKDIPRIFERFYRVDKARSRELGGTGLGLSIAKHIVELHGGSVGVESTEGLGSKFWFTLPM